LVDRAEIPAIVARSTSGVFAPLIDAFRSQIVIVDQAVQGVGWIRASGVPTAPGLEYSAGNHAKLPSGAGNIAIIVQERYAGTLSRSLAFLIDTFVTSALFFIVIYFTEKVIAVVTREEKNLSEEWTWTLILLNWIWQFIYFASALIASSRTLGKAILGLKVVNYEDGTNVKAKRALVRTFLLYLNIWSIVGVALGLLRRDRRELHDLIAGTGVVYSWDATMARYRQESVEEVQHLVTDSMIDRTAEQEGNIGSSVRRRFIFRRKKQEPSKQQVLVSDSDDDEENKGRNM
jgi:uncharacterized RDD family membrane protein YckC